LIEQNDDESRTRAFQFADINSKVNKNSADAQVTLAWVYFKLGRAADASNVLRQGLQLGTLSPDSSYLVASMLSSQNQPEQIEAAKRLLTETLTADAPGIFIHKKDAQELLKKLGGTLASDAAR
jgi:cytochrome c-type biogenesis protein CcmH/NrfG